MEIKTMKTIKLELEDDKEVYIMYEKPEPNVYECKVFAGKKNFGDLSHQFGFPVPIEQDIGIRVDTDEHYEEDIIRLVLTNIANDNFHWDEEMFS